MAKSLKVLIACEESQIVCKAFRERGHEAYSNDLIDCSGGHPEWHLKMDVFEAIDLMGWDMILSFNPCTKIALCGNSTYGVGCPKHSERLQAIDWTKKLWEKIKSKVSMASMENPKNVMGKHIRKRTQVIQPYEFGHLERKETWLWLHGLPKLVSTDNVFEQMMDLPKNERERIHYMPPTKNRGILRSKTFPGIARAMAAQWSDDLRFTNTNTFL
jgi:hypothetical protein